MTSLPWGVYRCKCIGCGCALLQVAHRDDVESGRVVIADGLCIPCSGGVDPSRYYMSETAMTTDQRTQRLQEIGIPSDFFGSDGKVKAENLSEYADLLREHFGKASA